MKGQLIKIFSKVIEVGIIVLVFLLPLFFLPITSESLEFPKQILLFFFVSILTIIWAAKMILESKVKILHSPLTIPILIFFLVFFISTIFSVHRFSSIYGPYPRLYGGLVSLISYLLLFFLVASNIKEKSQILRIFLALSLSGLLLVILGIFNFFDVSLLGDSLKARFLTPLGSADNTSLFLALILPILFLNFFFTERKNLAILSGVVSFLFIFYIFLISQIAAILAIFLILFLILLFAKFRLPSQTAKRMVIFFLICLLLLSINNFGPLRSKIPLLKERPIQHDISLDQNTGWAITTGSLQNLKLLTLGSGPGTYLFNFTLFKPFRFNQTPLWNFRFEKSSNEYFQIISTLGLLGFLAFLYLLWALRKIAKEIWQKSLRQTQTKEEIFSQICLFSILLFVFISLFSTAFTSISFVFWLFLGLILSTGKLLNISGIREVELSLATVQPKGLPEVKGEILPWLLGLIILLILIPLAWQEARIFRAEQHFSKAQVETDSNLILQSLQRARDTMPANDNYRRVLSATLLNLALLGEQQKTLSEDLKQQLLQLSIFEGEAATRLAPHNIFNWENLQQVYTLITVPRQEELLINNVFAQETLLDPLNPRHWNDLGWVYFNLRNDSEMAKWHFQRAISLKQDFADAHYNLARVYKQEEKKDRALSEYEQTLSLLEQQIRSLEPISPAREDVQRTLNQLRQSEQQVRQEKEELQAQIEAEKIAPPAEEIKPPAEEMPGSSE